MVGKHFGKTEQDDAQVNQHIHFIITSSGCST